MAVYTSRPRTSEGAGAVRLMLCEQADADCNRLCTARHSDLTSCDGSAGFDDREFFELLLAPGHRSPLYRSSRLAARFALGLATGQEWSHFYYLNGGAEIARVEVPDWLADDLEPLALSHAMLVKQCQLGLGLSRGRLRGPRAGHHLRPRSCRVPPPDPHAPGTARLACSGVRQGHIQAPALGPNTSSRQAGHPHGGRVSDPAISRTGGRDAGGNCSRMPGRSPIKRARRRWKVGPWLMLDINSAIPWRETRMPVGGPVGNSAGSQGGSDCGKRIRPRQRRPPGRPCHPAIYDSARSAKPLHTSGSDGLSAPRFPTGEVSQPPQRSQYILYYPAITVNDGLLPRHVLSLAPVDRIGSSSSARNTTCPSASPPDGLPVVCQ